MQVSRVLLEILKALAPTATADQAEIIACALISYLLSSAKPRRAADAPGGAEDWIVDVLCTLYADQGRPQDALAWLDDLKARRGKEEWELFWIRLPLMAACGRVDEAVELTRAHPEGTTLYAAEHVATLLANAGRTEDAVLVLERYAPANTSTLAGYLIDLGRIKDALALLQHTNPPPPAVPTTHLWLDEPPF
ncbi:hypothetical protein ACFTXM_34670 [Streptomyces sp. NPDC056930]|uniref:hypothetical protein n=1 Tax=Streptomyces sp. NPDC056930 TaxID=3345967 RepID=UPI00362FEAE1